MNLPPEATAALVDLMGAFRKYNHQLEAVVACGLTPPHPAMDQCEAYIRDAEQALITILTAVLGEPDVS